MEKIRQFVFYKKLPDSEKGMVISMYDDIWNEEIRKKLEELSEEKYRLFSSALIPDCNHMLGVRIPTLRKLAKRIAREPHWREYLENARDDSFEEILLQGLVIGYVKAPPEEILFFVKAFIPKIDNWSVNDSFCSGLKMCRTYQEEVWQFLQPYLKSDKEFEVRAAVVLLLNYYLNDRYIEEVLELYAAIRHEGYYVSMAIAWGLATAYVKYPRKVWDYLQKGRLAEETRQKALQKLRESYCVSKEDKIRIKTLV